MPIQTPRWAALVGALLLLLSWGPSASATDLTSLDVLALTDELVPALEAHTGRTFLEVPKVQIVDRDELYQRVLEGQLAVRRLMGLGEIDAEELQTWADLTDDAIGFYTYADRRIYLVSTGVDDLFESFTVPRDLEAPLLRCVLAHELVHALQHQYQPHPPLADAGQEPVARMMREGHANLVSRPFCTPDAVRRFFRFNDGIDVLAARGTEEEIPFLYGYGELYQELLTDRHGTEAGWWSLSQTPPSKAAIAAAVEPSLVPGWRGSGALDAAARSLMWAGAQGVVTPASPAELLQWQQGAAGVTALTSTQAGLVFAAASGDRAVTIMAFGFADPTEAAAQVTRRRKDLDAARSDGGELTFLGPVDAWAPRFKHRVPKRPAVPFDDALEVRFSIDSGRDYLESWAVRDGVLVIAAATGTALTLQEVTWAAGSVLARSLATLPPGGSPDTPLGLAVPAILPPPAASWEYPFLQVFRDINAEQWPACVAGAEAMLPSAPAEARDYVLQVGWTCALAAEDPDAALRFLEGLEDLTALDLDLLVGHAAFYSQARRWRDCLALLKRIEAAGAALPTEAVDLKIACMIESGRLSEASAAAQRREGTPLMRVHVSYALLSAERTREAMPILQEACPQLGGGDRVDCMDVMDRLTPRHR